MKGNKAMHSESAGAKGEYKVSVDLKKNRKL